MQPTKGTPTNKETTLELLRKDPYPFLSFAEIYTYVEFKYHYYNHRIIQLWLNIYMVDLDCLSKGQELNERG